MINYLLPILLVFAFFLPTSIYAAQTAMPVMLAKVAQSHIIYSDYLASEKFDGVRAIWDGESLRTRSGLTIPAPAWFTQGLGNVVVEGELWMGRGRFDDVSALVRRKQTEDKVWEQVAFKLFDMPHHPGVFSERVDALNVLVERLNHDWVESVERFYFLTEMEAKSALDELVAEGGEGLMLNRKNAVYQANRTDAILKLKPKWDDEAKVVGYSEGKGKYTGMMGALVVEWENGRQFKIGTGFSDLDRKAPPELGTLVTFEYSGFTSKGLPRFARFVRVYQSL
jgi:DNA ligase-1